MNNVKDILLALIAIVEKVMCKVKKAGNTKKAIVLDNFYNLLTKQGHVITNDEKTIF